ncbi:2-oxo-4-hydroxy-4-carboxy-5-ureidoimidazoline decarboxylase [Nymphon striatum]|nr:2-oxo-4-hydroxy-4-carboxy-5-ureidoimidazoline decarboxylase [Nymphon striatum]
MLDRTVEIQPIMTENVALDQVDRYTYLGQLISIHRDWEPEVRRRVALAKEGILRLYLDLPVSQRELTSDSYLERESAGLNNPDESYLRELTSLNDAYRSKFNFHFVICVRQTDQKGILEAMKTRLGHSSEEEISVGIKEDLNLKAGYPYGLCANVLWAKRPFRTSQDILAAVCQFLEELTNSSKEGILRLYPDLAGSHSLKGELTSDSYLEHESAGLNNPDEIVVSINPVAFARIKSKWKRNTPTAVPGNTTKKSSSAPVTVRNSHLFPSSITEVKEITISSSGIDGSTRKGSGFPFTDPTSTGGDGKFNYLRAPLKTTTELRSSRIPKENHTRCLSFQYEASNSGLVPTDSTLDVTLEDIDIEDIVDIEDIDIDIEDIDIVT